jgi:propionyl-CoA carboxylase alpha chain
MNWQVIDDGKIINSKISFNNFNKSYDIYIGKKYLNLKSNWNIGHPLFSAIIDNNLSYFSIKRDGPKFLINHNGSSSELLVFSKRHAELNEIMIPRKKEDLSRLLLAPMPGLLVSLLVKEKQVVDENQPLAIIEAMKMENIIRSEKKTKIKKINCSEGDSLEVDQIILEFE